MVALMVRRRGPAAVAGPLRRLVRDRGRLVAILLLAATAIAASGIQSGAAIALQRTLSANWRGAYDILVTSTALHAGSGSLLAPNALGDGAHGMTLAQLGQVRRVSGVDVAAPLGDVLTAGSTSAVPPITLPVSSAAADAARESPQAYRLTATVTTDDGLGSRIVTTQTAQNVVDLRPDRPGTPETSTADGDNSYNGVAIDCTTYPALCTSAAQPAPEVTTVSGDGFGTDTADNGVLSLGFPGGNLLTSTRITLIDPAAERKLLGARGDFLSALQKLPTAKVADASAMTAWANRDAGAFGRCFLAQNADAAGADESDRSDEYRAELKAFLAAHPKAAAVRDAAYVPVLVSSAPAAGLRVRVRISSLGAVPPAAATDSAPAGYVLPASSATATTVGTAEGDESSKLNPFLGATRSIPFPGTPQQSLDAGTCPDAHSLNLYNLGVTASSGVRSASADRVTLAPTGYLVPSAPVDSGADPFAAIADGTAVGAEAIYQPVKELRVGEDFGGATAVPVGRFSGASLAAYEKTLDYVPLGAYQPVGARVRVGGTGQGLPRLQPLAPERGHRRPLRRRRHGVERAVHQLELRVAHRAQPGEGVGRGIGVGHDITSSSPRP